MGSLKFCIISFKFFKHPFTVGDVLSMNHDHIGRNINVCYDEMLFLTAGKKFIRFFFLNRLLSLKAPVKGFEHFRNFTVSLAGSYAYQFLRFSDGRIASPKPFPLTIRSVPFGTWAPTSQDVISLAGGGFAAWELSGTQTQPQVIALRAIGGGLPPANVGLAIVRVR